MYVLAISDNVDEEVASVQQPFILGNLYYIWECILWIFYELCEHSCRYFLLMEYAILSTEYVRDMQYLIEQKVAFVSDSESLVRCVCVCCMRFLLVTRT